MKKTAAFTILVSMGAIGCGSGSFYRNTEYAYPIAIDDTSHALVMPADLHLGGDAGSMSVAFTAGIASACGSSCLSAEPLGPVLARMQIQSLRWMLAEGMYHAASTHGGPHWDHEYADMPSLLTQLRQAVDEAYPGANPRYLVVGHVDDLHTPVSATTKLRVLGGLYDLERNQIATVFWYEEAMPSDTVPVNVGMMGERILSLATCPMDDDGCTRAAQAFHLDDLHTIRF